MCGKGLIVVIPYNSLVIVFSEVLAFFKVKIDGDDESKKCESRASCGTELQIIIFITIIISCNAVAS